MANTTSPPRSRSLSRAKGSGIRDRIVELRRVRAGDLLPDPRNWRRHPKAQRDALQGVLQEVGYADALLARETQEGLVLVDGHLRADLDPDQVVPVLVLDVTEEEAAKLLATLDPLAAMAETNTEALNELLKEVSFNSRDVNEMLEALAKGSTVPFPDLSDEDKSSIGQMTFTVSDEQKEVIERALKAAKGMGAFVTPGNENSNGNALARVCETFLTVSINA